jgi:nitronate monooxygenase
VVEVERRGGATFEDVRELVAGTRGRDALTNGDTDGGIWSAGMIQGLIHDIPTCKALIDRIMAEAEALIKGRLEGLVA